MHVADTTNTHGKSTPNKLLGQDKWPIIVAINISLL